MRACLDGIEAATQRTQECVRQYATVSPRTPTGAQIGAPPAVRMLTTPPSSPAEPSASLVMAIQSLLAQVGYEQTRNRGTLCGSLAHADPAAELPAGPFATSGLFKVRNGITRSFISARALLLAYLSNSLSSDALIG